MVTPLCPLWFAFILDHTNADAVEMESDTIREMCVNRVNASVIRNQALKDGTVYLKGSVKLDPSKSPKAADWAIEGTDMISGESPWWITLISTRSVTGWRSHRLPRP